MNRSILLILSGCLAVSMPLEAAPISQLVVFGDSLSDNGNVAIALGGALPGNYAPNAFTDGPATVPATGAPLGLWIDQLALRLGVVDPHPFLAGGTDYAVGSALTGHNPAFSLQPSPSAVPYTSDQVALYLSGHVPSSNALYAFWAGAEDVFAAVDPTAAANNVGTNIQTLAAAGATNFLWLNLPPLGDTPDAMASGQAAALNAASLAYDTQWAADIASLSNVGIHVTGVNINQLFIQIASDPALFGFTDVSHPAWCGPGGLPHVPQTIRINSCFGTAGTRPRQPMRISQLLRTPTSWQPLSPTAYRSVCWACAAWWAPRIVSEPVMLSIDGVFRTLPESTVHEKASS